MAKQLNVNHRILQPLIRQTDIAHSAAYVRRQLQHLVQAHLRNLLLVTTLSPLRTSLIYCQLLQHSWERDPLLRLAALLRQELLLVLINNQKSPLDRPMNTLTKLKRYLE